MMGVMCFKSFPVFSFLYDHFILCLFKIATIVFTTVRNLFIRFHNQIIQTVNLKANISTFSSQQDTILNSNMA